MRPVVQTDLGWVKFQGALTTSRCMKMRAASIVLLLTVSALAGCTGDSDSDDSALAGTSWIMKAEMPGYDTEEMIEEIGFDVISIRTFGEDGSIEDFSLAGVEGCPMGTVSYTEDESLCVADTSSLGEMSASMEWRIDDNGHLIMSSVMVMVDDNSELAMDEMDCNMMGGMMEDNEYLSHYSDIEYTVNWLDDENACEIGSEMKMTMILGPCKAGRCIAYHLVHPVMEDDMVDMTCAVGIEWTGQTELSESELASIQSLFSRCPAAIPSDAVVWDCRLDVRLDSLPDFSEQSFNDSISEHPGYPEWCGAIVPENLALDGSEPNLPPAEDLYGENLGGGVWARSETRYVGSWYSQEECSANEGTWDEDYSMCSFPVDCIPEADSQLIYEECLPSQYARYHWSGDYLYIGMPSNSLWIN